MPLGGLIRGVLVSRILVSESALTCIVVVITKLIRYRCKRSLQRAQNTFIIASTLRIILKWFFLLRALAFGVIYLFANWTF